MLAWQRVDSGHRHPGRSTIVECVDHSHAGLATLAVERSGHHTPVVWAQRNEGQGQGHGAFDVGLIGCLGRPSCGALLFTGIAQMINIALSLRKRPCPGKTRNVSFKLGVLRCRGGYFLRFSGATPDCVRCHSALASSAAALSGAGAFAAAAAGVAAPCGVSTSPSKSSSRVRARCGWRR